MHTVPINDDALLAILDEHRHATTGQVNSSSLAKAIGRPRSTVQDALFRLAEQGRISSSKKTPNTSIPTKPVRYEPQAAWTEGGPAIELMSTSDNTFIFLASGDLHAASKYCRWDVRRDLIKKAENRGATAIFDTGNWIDGEASFNRYDIEASGLEPQIQLLAREHPKTVLPIYAVAGDDHEGWYTQREGINVGRYAAAAMRNAGHNWTDLGYMEAHVRLVNANSGKSQIMAVVHPGGGSAYAISYRPQKIIESYEGGEKPAVALFGHYHKLEHAIVRNVFSIQTGCCQDQTPFMRKKSLEAHVGGVLVRLEQDPKTGAIVECDAGLRRYFNQAYYDVSKRWSHSGPVGQVHRVS